MNRESIFKLRAGQTLYTVGKKLGIVSATHIHQVKSEAGFPLVSGLSWIIMDCGKYPYRAPAPSRETVWFAPCDGFSDADFGQTLSRKQAIRWAKEGYAIAKGVWAVQGEYMLRFNITTAETAEENGEEIPQDWTPTMVEEIKKLAAEL